MRTQIYHGHESLTGSLDGKEDHYPCGDAIANKQLGKGESALYEIKVFMLQVLYL